MIGDRLRKLRKSHGLNQEKMAELMGITRRSYGLYEKGTRTPTAERLSLIAEKLPVSLDWLVMEDGKSSAHMIKDDTFMPVRLLAECGIKGWQEEKGESTLKVGRPNDLTNDNAFAVMATGPSLVPEGIRPGYVCLCDPETTPKSGDIVYIREKSGRCALKIFRLKDDNWVHVEGYLPPDEVGEQLIYCEKRKLDLIKILATVIYVKRRP